MAALREAVNEALKAAMKSRDAARRLDAPHDAAPPSRTATSRRAAGGGEAASDDELLASLAKMIRQREESAKAFEDGGRPELAAKERAEIEVIRGFMPKQMDGGGGRGRGRGRDRGDRRRRRSATWARSWRC